MGFWNYFPLNIKNFWIYKISEKFSNDYVLTRVVINEKIPFSEKIIYIFSYYIDDEEIKKESYVIQNDGIYLYAKKVENNLVVFDPLVPFLPYNFEDVDWWNWEGKAGFIPTKILFQNKKIIEENTYKIVYTEENKYGKSEYSILLKKNVGIVREEAETPYIGYVSELVDHSVSFDDFSFIDFKTFDDSGIVDGESSNLEGYGFEEFIDNDVINYGNYEDDMVDFVEDNVPDDFFVEDITHDDDLYEEEQDNENRW
ncbi:MAG: hypothetical protein RMJ36_02955 [Candidatus Calescibacterium sp.]|nr:hypothetical protein [Candidatus Calescibacterium sp.]MDW8132598.1 hypothetical protein [Candidatus Calescibacterium sp.]